MVRWTMVDDIHYHAASTLCRSCHLLFMASDPICEPRPVRNQSLATDQRFRLEKSLPHFGTVSAHGFHQPSSCLIGPTNICCLEPQQNASWIRHHYLYQFFHIFPYFSSPKALQDLLANPSDLGAEVSGAPHHETGRSHDPQLVLQVEKTCRNTLHRIASP